MEGGQLVKRPLTEVEIQEMKAETDRDRLAFDTKFKFAELDFDNSRLKAAEPRLKAAESRAQVRDFAHKIY